MGPTCSKLEYSITRYNYSFSRLTGMKVGHFAPYSGYLFLYEHFFRTASVKHYTEAYDKVEKLSGYNSICYVCP